MLPGGLLAARLFPRDVCRQSEVRYQPRQLIPQRSCGIRPASGSTVLAAFQCECAFFWVARVLASHQMVTCMRRRSSWNRGREQECQQGSFDCDSATSFRWASDDQSIRVWELATGTTLASFRGESVFKSCGVAPDGLIIVAGDDKGAVHFLRSRQ